MKIIQVLNKIISCEKDILEKKSIFDIIKKISNEKNIFKFRNYCQH